jgi:hypothetical protein
MCLLDGTYSRGVGLKRRYMLFGFFEFLLEAPDATSCRQFRRRVRVHTVISCRADTIRPNHQALERSEQHGGRRNI